MFIQYFESTPIESQYEFDDKHRELCKAIIADFKNIKYNKMEFGQAQKIINVSLKIFACVLDAKEDFFKHCHMILDSYTLGWYNKFVAQNKTKTPWSKMSEAEYYDIQRKIKEIIVGVR